MEYGQLATLKKTFRKILTVTKLEPYYSFTVPFKFFLPTFSKRTKL